MTFLVDGMLLATRKTTAPSIMQLRSQAVLRAIRTTQPHLENGDLASVDPAHQRIRLLPL